MDYQESGIVLTVFQIMQQSTDNRHLIFGQSHYIYFKFDKDEQQDKRIQKMDHTKKLMNKQKKLIVSKSRINLAHSFTDALIYLNKVKKIIFTFYNILKHSNEISFI